MKGWPSEREQVDELASEYWSFKEELSVEDGLLFKSDSLVAPRPLRAEVLDEIHGAHMGQSKSLCFARDCVFWPSMTDQRQSKVMFNNAFRNQQQRESLCASTRHRRISLASSRNCPVWICRPHILLFKVF